MGLNPGLLYKLFGIINCTENLARVTSLNFIIITSSLGNSPGDRALLEQP